MINIVEALKDRITGKAPKGAKRSKYWRSVRADYMDENPLCEICNKDKKLEVHHIIPFHVAPDLELRHDNMITLCRKHHFTFGHIENWRITNPSVEADAAYWRTKFENRSE